MADALAVKQVNFKDGVYLHGVVAQSVGVEGVQPGSLSGVRLVRSIVIPERGPGVLVDMDAGGTTRRFLVPWASISSVEIIIPEPAQAPQAQAQGRK